MAEQLKELQLPKHKQPFDKVKDGFRKLIRYKAHEVRAGFKAKLILAQINKIKEDDPNKAELNATDTLDLNKIHKNSLVRFTLQNGVFLEYVHTISTVHRRSTSDIHFLFAINPYMSHTLTLINQKIKVNPNSGAQITRSSVDNSISTLLGKRQKSEVAKIEIFPIQIATNEPSLFEIEQLIADKIINEL